MIRISDMKGSKEFRPLLIRAGAKVRLVPLAEMPFADFAFWGNGPSGRVRVGIERKTITEIAGSIGPCRFVDHQIPGMIRRYPYRFVVIEGEQTITKEGLLSPWLLRNLPQRAHLYRTIQKFELTVTLKGGFRIIHTKDRRHTALAVEAVYSWFQATWKSHKSSYQVQEDKPDRALLDQRTMKRKTANQWTGLAWQRSLLADAYFPSIASMAVGDPGYEATPQELSAAVGHWKEALGLKKGVKRAQAIVEICHRRDDIDAKGL